jgi:peptidoglycan hydrolase CwlO-like protein
MMLTIDEHSEAIRELQTRIDRLEVTVGRLLTLIEMEDKVDREITNTMKYMSQRIDILEQRISLRKL